MVGSEGGDTAEVSAGGRGGGRNVVVGVAIVVLAVVVPWSAVWVAAWPGSRPWGPVLFIVGCVAVASAVSGVRRLTQRRTVVVLVAGTVAVSSVAALWSYQSAVLLHRRLETALDRLALAAQYAEGFSMCEELPNGPVEVPGIGRVDQMCETDFGTVFYGHLVPPVLAYSELEIPSEPPEFHDQLFDLCVGRISTHWAERVVPDGSDCPAGFTIRTTQDPSPIHEDDLGY